MPRLSKIGAAALAAFGWTGLSTVSASYLVVAGGGAGGGTTNGGGQGGGGAGGLLTGTVSLNPTQSYTVVVGAGGASGTSTGVSGSNSQFGTLTASVGGGGGGGGTGATQQSGLSGGSGGGAGNDSSAGITAGSGTSGQGNAGGSNGGTGSGNYPAGGGGGAGAAGGNGSGSTAGSGGVGISSSISGTATYYAGGGGGGVRTGGTAGSGGNGGGGAGTATSNTNGNPGSANTGGGGGGSSQTGGNVIYGGQGGSGVVIISYPSPQKFGGGIVTTSGSNVIHTFQTSGTLSPLSSLTASYLIVAGGAAGGGNVGGGGGAGGLVTGSGATIDTNSTYVVTVGAGGAAVSGTNGGNNGTNSSFSIVSTTAIGGGGGGARTGGAAVAAQVGGSGGGGGGSTSNAGAGAAGTSGQGNTGGNAQISSNFSSGGGGGAGAVGSNATAGSGGAGGVGLTSSISGSSTYYAGGGGGGGNTGSGVGYGAGGLGGGGAGGNPGVSGTANTGGGGGGGGDGTTSMTGGSGGSGIVIISYAGSTQQMAGGTVTISGGNVIHTFTSSGYLAPLKFVGNSLRFRTSASAYLNRSFTTPTSQQKGTMSMWVKRGALSGSTRYNLFSNDNGTQYGFMEFNNDNLNFSDYNIGQLLTTQVFRDPAAWYHIVVSIDTTQATASNRYKMYINGNQVTAFGTATYCSQNANSYFLQNGSAVQIGAFTRNGTPNFDGEMTEINFIDGQALTPNAFGTFNSYGVWQPITYGGSYGTNGFYLPFNGNQQGYTGIFNGSNQYLTLTSNSNLVVASSTPFTLECFVNFNNFTATSQYPSIVTFPGGYQLYVNSAVVRFYNGSSDLVTGTIGTGGWNHIAVSRDASGNLSMWINGIRTSTTTGFTSSFGSSSGTFLIASYNGTGGFVNGYISNLRFVNGSAVYDPTQANITVPTTTLTAVTNTKLLTCQNATFVDNSTSAFTITNNGTATTAQTYPMSYNIQYDRGPSGNNWTSSGISYTTGSTLDVMTDVPTLTSATASNFPTLNPLMTTNSGNYSITNGNLTFTQTTASGNQSVIGSTMASSQSFYFEVTTSSAANSTGIGVIDSTFIPVVNSTYQGNASAKAWTYGGSAVYNNAGSVATTTMAGSTTYAFAISPSTGKFWVGSISSGTITWFNSGNPSAGTNAIYSNLPSSVAPYVEVGSNGNFVNANFGQQPFQASSLPTGFLALNTYNL